MPTPSNGQILIRNRAIAINPVDWYVQSHGIIFEKFPAVIGEDVAGEVIAIGPDVTTFKVGDRVLGCADSMKGYGAFQLYPIVPEAIAAKIPETVSFAEGAVLPLATQTASYSLFAKSCLGLPYPELKPKETGKTLVIWGAGTSVGSCAVQMARAAGYKVFATASEKNFEYCKGLGAERVFDYNTSTVVEDVLKALENQDPVGVMVAIGVDTAVVGAAQVASQLKGRKPLATVFVSLDQQKMVVPKGIPENVEIFVCMLPRVYARDEYG